MTMLAEASAAIHEMFLAYVKAGFTESQALYLTAAVATAQIRPMPPQP
jgi:hypothetical protein